MSIKSSKITLMTMTIACMLNCNANILQKTANRALRMVPRLGRPFSTQFSPEYLQGLGERLSIKGFENEVIECSADLALQLKAPKLLSMIHDYQRGKRGLHEVDTGIHMPMKQAIEEVYKNTMTLIDRLAVYPSNQQPVTLAAIGHCKEIINDSYTTYTTFETTRKTQEAAALQAEELVNADIRAKIDALGKNK